MGLMSGQSPSLTDTTSFTIEMPYAKYRNKIYRSIYMAIIVMSRFIIMFIYTL